MSVPRSVAAFPRLRSRTHLRELIAIDDPLKRQFYNEEQIELLELTDGSVRVASYLTELPPRELLERKLLESIEHARARALAHPRLPGDVP